MPLIVSQEQPPHITEATPRAGASWAEPQLPLEGGPSEPGVESDSDFAIAEYHEAPHSAPWSPPEESLPDLGVLRSLFQAEVVPAPSRRRFYIGVVFAILLGLLVYVTWRGGAGFWGGVTAPAQLPRAVPAEQHEPPALVQPTPNQNAARTSAPPAAPVPKQKQPDTSSQRDTAVDTRLTPRNVFVNAVSSTASAEQGGSEELARAEKYLNARPGVTRDTQEGAKWLWKAVAKKNLAATLLLSDLYLRGDGVPKSCDQARLLLDAAARKGGTAAAERLRNLQAFGCQ